MKALYGEVQTQLFEQRLSQAFSSLCNPTPVIDWGGPATLLKGAPQ
jgi:hypothetical protein